LYPWYKRFLVDTVVPHQELFGYLVMLGEIAVGTCLLLGFLTRLSACVGLVMLVNYYLGPGMARGGATVAQQQTFIVALIVFLLSNPGRALGLDGLIFRGGRGAK
jgi:thiosulfate dehydrogenase [quinone] large subunit